MTCPALIVAATTVFLWASPEMKAAALKAGQLDRLAKQAREKG